MLVLSREIGTSLFVDESFLITVIDLFPDRRVATVRLTRAVAERPGRLDVRTTQLPVGGSQAIDPRSDFVILDVTAENARIGINAPREYSVHRLELYETMRKQSDKRDDSDDGAAGARVPKPSPPRPPTLDVRLTEPPPETTDRDAGRSP